MLENYYKNGVATTNDETKRLIAVQAALEIAKAGAAESGTTHGLDGVISYIAKAADAIQDALKINE